MIHALHGEWSRIVGVSKATDANENANRGVGADKTKTPTEGLATFETHQIGSNSASRDRPGR